MGLDSKLAIRVGLLSAFLLVTLWNAWLADDAYIIYRTVDNFVNGFGLRWNVIERVQTYSCPLWMFLVSGVYFFTRESFYTNIALCSIVSTAATAVVIFGAARSVASASITVTCLVLSKAFIDYSTSGLENPLTHLLVGTFFLIYFRATPDSPRICVLALIAALIMVNRLDSGLLVGPAMLFVLWTHRSVRSFAIAGVGFLVLLAWFGFAMAYYGFILPNTAYAKLITGVDRLSLAHNGANYLLTSFLTDPVTVLVIFGSLIAIIATASIRFVAAGAGIVLHLAYLILIGGDFMSGRFLSAVFILSIVAFLNCRLPIPRRAGWIGIGGMAILGLANLNSPIYNRMYWDPKFEARDQFDRVRTADERAFYYQSCGLLNAWRYPEMPAYPWRYSGLRYAADAVTEPQVIVSGAVGMRGFFAGPRVHIIDRVGITDPFLSRCPPQSISNWRIGHFERWVPPDYVTSVRANRNLFQDPDLALYYDKIRLITMDPLWSKERFQAIIQMHLGKYTHLIDKDIFRESRN